MSFASLWQTIGYFKMIQSPSFANFSLNSPWSLAVPSQGSLAATWLGAATHSLRVQQNDLHELCTQVMKGNPSPAGCRESGMSCKQTKPRKESQSGFWGWILFDSDYTDQSYRCHHLSLHLQGDKYCLSGSQHPEYGCVEYGILLQDSLQQPLVCSHTWPWTSSPTALPTLVHLLHGDSESDTAGEALLSGCGANAAGCCLSVPLYGRAVAGPGSIQAIYPSSQPVSSTALLIP